MIKEVKLNVEILRKVILAKSKEEDRYYLCGIHIYDKLEDNKLYRFYEATNGHLLIQAKESIDEIVLEPQIFAFDKKQLDKFKKQEYICFRKIENFWILEDEFVIKTIDVQYPDVSRAIPDDALPATDYTLFDPKYMKIIKDNFNHFFSKIPLMDNGKSLAYWYDNVYKVVLMPMRSW